MRVDPVFNLSDLANRAAGAGATAIELGHQRLESWRCEFLALQTLQYISKQHQAFGVARNAFVDMVCAVVEHAAENNFEDHHAEDRPGVELADRPREGGDESEGKNDG